MQVRQARVAQLLALSLASALRGSGRLKLEAAATPVLLVATLGDAKVRVFEDGRIEFSPAPEMQALLLQCIKGILPTVDTAFLVGVDESGMGADAANPAVAVVLLPSEVRAELVVEGVCDSKQVPANVLAHAADAVLQRALRTEILQVPKGEKSNASAVAAAVAKLLLEWDDNGHLPPSAQITIDQTDEAALQAGFGDAWERFRDRIVVQPKADEEFVEVAAASILARANRTPGAKPATPASPDMGVFQIGAWKPTDKQQVLGYLSDLQHSYPDIGKWIKTDTDPSGVWAKVETGKYQLLVARMNDAVVGFSLSQRKDERNVKLSTFFVVQRYRHHKIGHRLLDTELHRFAKDGVRRVMVTFGHEEFGSMAPFFREHGFTVDGISPQRYRDNSYEVVMGKRFRSGTVEPTQFRGFVEADLFRMQGFNVKPLDAETFIAQPTASLVQGPAAKAARLVVRVTTAAEPEKQLKAIRDAAALHAGAPVLASSFGFPCDAPMPADVDVFDAYELERMFSPVNIARPGDKDVVIPIKPEYAGVLFPEPKQATLGVSKVGLRTNNVYYKVAKNDAGLRRGSRIFFYESEGRGIFGYGRMEEVITGSPKQVHAKTRGLGAWSLAQIKQHVGEAEVAAYRFAGWRRLKAPVTNEQIKALHPTYNPITAYRIPNEVGNKVIALGDTA